MAGDHEKITAVINLLTTEFTHSPQANHRKVEERFNYLSNMVGFSPFSLSRDEFRIDFFFFFNVFKFPLKGGLIGLAAATVGLTTEAAQHLEVRVWLNIMLIVDGYCPTKKLFNGLLSLVASKSPLRKSKIL